MNEGATTRSNRQVESVRKIITLLKNLEQRVGFLEMKMDLLNDHTKKGNDTRNLIAFVVAIKVVLDGMGHIDVGQIGQLLKLFGG